MSDTNYMNAYVNLVMETVHSNLNDILQLKTQAKLLNDLVLEKDQVISSLNEQLERANQEKEHAIRSLNDHVESLGNERSSREVVESELQKFKDETNAEMQRLRDNAANWETQYNNMSGKASHMDTLAKQYNELQKEFSNLGTKHVEVINTNKQYESTIKDYQEKVQSLENELSSIKTKLGKLEKKEEKKVVTSPVPVKKSINKEEAKPISIPPRIEISKETDDDF